MRITQQMIQQNSLRHMQQNLSRMDSIYNQLASSKKLLKPSDDPSGVSKALQLKSTIKANEQYKKNTNEANLYLDESDQTISGMVKVMQRVRDLALQASNGSNEEKDLKAIASEVKELSEQIRSFANTKVNGIYLFNGHKTNQAPYPESDSYLVDSFDTGAKNYTIAEGIVIKANVTADELFGYSTDESNLFATLNKFVESLQSSGDIPLDEIDSSIDRLLTVQSEIGARKNRVDAISNRVEDINIELQSMLSKIEDIDYAEALTKYKSEESIYQASLQATARVIQLSLMNFLK